MKKINRSESAANCLPCREEGGAGDGRGREETEREEGGDREGGGRRPGGSGC